MPGFQNNDLAFRSPSGDSADDTRSAFERTDARIKRMLESVSSYSVAVDVSLSAVDAGLIQRQLETEAVASSLTSTTVALQSADTGLQGSINVVAGNLQAYENAFGARFASSFTSSIGTVFTTASNPGFAQIQVLTTTPADFILVGLATGAPRWQTKANFVLHTVGLTIPKPVSTWHYNSDAWTTWGGNPNGFATRIQIESTLNYCEGITNAINTDLIFLINQLKAAGILS